MSAIDPELAIAAGRVDLLVAHVRAAHSVAARRFALDALARGLLAADPGSVGPALREEALALRVDPSTVAAAAADRLPHAVRVPLIARDGAFGLVRQVHVTFDPVGLSDHGLLDDDARLAVTRAIEAAARATRPPSDPARHCLVAAQPRALRHARVEGRSLSAAAFVSAAALFGGHATRPEVAITGELHGDRVLAVGAIGAKVAAAIAHDVPTLIVPAANEAEARAAAADAITVQAVEDARALLDAALSRSARPQHPERAVADAREHAAKGWSGYRWPSIRERLGRVSGTLPEYRLDLRVEMLARLAAAQRHLGDPQGSLTILDEAEALVRSEEGRRAVPDAPICDLFMQRAMTCRQLSRFGEATRAATRAVSVARRARLRRELIKALGCSGLVAMSRRQHGRAIAAFDESLAVTLRHEPERTARTHAYLIEAHAAAGNARDAEAHFDAAMRELEDAHDQADRRARESWVRTSWGGALLALERPRDAVRALDLASVAASIAEEPLPGLLARRHLGLALSRAGEPERGLVLLAASPLVYGRALEPHLAFVAHLNVLFEARERIAHRAWGKDIAGRARRALEHVPRDGSVGAFLGGALTRTAALLERDPPTRTKPLDALLDRCARLG